MSHGDNLPGEEGTNAMEWLKEEIRNKAPSDEDAILIDQKVSKSGLSGQRGK
jgi:hypothetical protein